MSWETFTKHLKMQYYSEIDLIELNNKFQNLKKGKISVDEYVTAFTDRMKLFPYLVPTKLSKIDRFANGLPAVFGPMVKMATTLKTAVREAKNIETQIRERGLEKNKAGEKKKFEGSSRPNKESKFLKFGGGGRGKARWCHKCEKKHLGKCGEEVICFKCGKSNHYANECTLNKRICFRCNKEGHISRDYPK